MLNISFKKTKGGRRIQAEVEKLDEAIKELENDSGQTVILAKRKAGVRLPALRLTRDLL